MTIQEFIAKWRKVELKERSAAQTHFIDLCWPADLTDETILERLLSLNLAAFSRKLCRAAVGGLEHAS
jgi:hypothetical protein